MRNPRVTTPAILVAHGSRDRRSAAVVRDIAAATGTVAAFLDFDRPHPVEVLTGLADAGHRRAALVPLLLTRAHHSRVDIPDIVNRVGALRPGLLVAVTAEVGGDALLPALKRPLPACDAIVLASAGTRDPAALAAVSGLADRLSQQTGKPCAAGYAAAAAPGIAEAVDGCRAAGADRVAVASYFIAPGRLHDRVLHLAFAHGAIAVSAPLGACPELVAVIRTRYSTPTEARVAGATSSATVPNPRIHAGTANHHSPASAR